MRKWKPATLCWKFSHISFFLWLLSHVLVTLSILNKYGVIRWLTFWFTLSLKGDFWKRWEKLSLLGFVNFSLFSHMALSGTIWAFLLNFHISKYGTLFPKSWDIVPCIVKKKPMTAWSREDVWKWLGRIEYAAVGYYLNH